MALQPHLQEHGGHVDQGIDGFQRPALPFPGPLHDFVRDRAHRLGRDLVAVKVLDMGLDVPGRHPLGVHRDDFLLQTGDVFLTFLDDLGLKIGFSVSGDIQVDLAELGLDGLGGIAVSGVVNGFCFLVVFFEAQMVGQLSLEQRFDDLLADLPHEGVKIVQGFNALLLEQLFQFFSVKSQWNLLDSFYSFKEVYTVFLTLPISMERIEFLSKRGLLKFASGFCARYLFAA